MFKKNQKKDKTPKKSLIFKFKNNLRYKYGFFLIVLPLFITAVAQSLVLINSSQVQKRTIEQNQRLNLETLNNKILNFFPKKNLIESFTYNPIIKNFLTNNDWSNIKNYEDLEQVHKYQDVRAILQSLESLDNILLGYISSLESNIPITGEKLIGLDYESFDVRTRNWYTGALGDIGHLFYTNPYIDSASGYLVITVSYAIKDKDDIVGVIGIDYQLSTIQDFISTFKPKVEIAEFKPYLMTKNYLIHFPLDKDSIRKSGETLVEFTEETPFLGQKYSELKNITRDFMDFQLEEENKEYFFYSANLKGGNGLENWIIGLYSEYHDYNASIVANQIAVVFQFLITVVFISGIWLLILKFLIKPLEDIDKTLNNIVHKEGDFITLKHITLEH